ncbi:MAG: hypothetical protein Q9162_005332 [Coniocarpon cinnabarinum]
MAIAGAVIPPLHQRPIGNTVCLFDVDGTLTPARRNVSPEMLQLLTRLRQHCAIGTVGGSNLVKQEEQLATTGLPVTTLFDFNFAENGLIAYRMGQPLASSSFIQWLGEDKYKELAKFILHYIADLDVPVKRGTFIEFRNSMINVSPVGRNASNEERAEYEKFDLATNTREKFIQALKERFPDMGLQYSIGGQISFDVFPRGWDKRYCLQHIEAEAKRHGDEAVQYTTIHFFGDKTHEGGNDHEIYEDPRTVGHSVKNPEDTMAELKKLFPALQT